MEAFYEFDRDNRDELLIEFQTSSACPPHFHTCIEVLYVCGGELTATVNGETANLCVGDLYVAGPYEIHSNFTKTCSKSILLIIPETLARGFTERSEGRKFGSPFLIRYRESREIWRCLNRIYDANARGDGNDLILMGYIDVILGILTRALTLTEIKDRTIGSLIRNILMYVQKGYKTGLSLEETAREFGYSSYYFCRLFRRYFGCGFKDYISLLRARNAASLLAREGCSVISAALESGFDNQRTFNRVFKSIYHKTPTEYREGCGRRFVSPHEEGDASGF